MIRLVEIMIRYNKNLWSGENRKECTKILHIALEKTDTFVWKVKENHRGSEDTSGLKNSRIQNGGHTNKHEHDYLSADAFKADGTW